MKWFKIWLVFLIVAVWGHFLISLTSLTTTFAPDFSVFYLTAKNLLAQTNPHQNRQVFTILGYPPSAFLFFLPLTFFNQLFAQNLFLTISLLSLAGIIFVSAKIANQKMKPLAVAFFSALAIFSLFKNSRKPIIFTFTSS
jgi:hypothetical protein